MLVIAPKYFQRAVCVIKLIIRGINTFIWKDQHRCFLLSNLNKHDPKAPGVKSNMYTKRWHQNHFKRKWGGKVFFNLKILIGIDQLFYYRIKCNVDIRWANFKRIRSNMQFLKTGHYCRIKNPPVLVIATACKHFPTYYYYYVPPYTL